MRDWKANQSKSDVSSVNRQLLTVSLCSLYSPILITPLIKFDKLINPGQFKDAHTVYTNTRPCPPASQKMYFRVPLPAKWPKLSGHLLGHGPLWNTTFGDVIGQVCVPLILDYGRPLEFINDKVLNLVLNMFNVVQS